MKFNITPEDCDFFINKEKNTIVCTLNNTKKLFIDFIYHNCKIPIDFAFMPNKDVRNLYGKLAMPNRFIGVAKCGKDDEWNEKVGRLIAFSRMKDNLNRSFFKRAKTYFKVLDKWLDESVELINTIGEKLEVNQEHRHNLIENYLTKE